MNTSCSRCHEKWAQKPIRPVKTSFQDQRGPASVTEIGLKLPFVCLHRSPIRYGFRKGARRTLYCVGMGLYREAESLENKVVRYLRNEQEVFTIKNWYMHMYLSQKGNIKYNRFEAAVKPHFFCECGCLKHLITPASSPVASFVSLWLVANKGEREKRLIVDETWGNTRGRNKRSEATSRSLLPSHRPLRAKTHCKKEVWKQGSNRASHCSFL